MDKITGAIPEKLIYIRGRSREEHFVKELTKVLKASHKKFWGKPKKKVRR